MYIRTSLWHHMWICVCIYIYTHTHTHTHKYIYIYIYTWPTAVVETRTYLFTLVSLISQLSNPWISTHGHAYYLIYTLIYTYIHMLTYTNIKPLKYGNKAVGINKNDNIYSHPQTDCFVLSELFSVARHAGSSKPESKPVQLYDRLRLQTTRPQTDYVG